MKSIGERLYQEAASSAFYTPFVLAGGAFIGYAYATMAGLPASQVARAWAIWVTAEYVITSFGSAFADTQAKLLFIKATLFTLTGSIGIEELRKQKVLGDRMMVTLILIRALTVLGLLTGAAVAIRRAKAQENQTKQSVST